MLGYRSKPGPRRRQHDDSSTEAIPMETVAAGLKTDALSQLQNLTVPGPVGDRQRVGISIPKKEIRTKSVSRAPGNHCKQLRFIGESTCSWV